MVFGIFATTEDTNKIIEMFKVKAKEFIKAEDRKKSAGRIWCIEINGTVKGCGVIAADDTIKVWKEL